MQDGHSCPSHHHETLPKRRLLWLDSRWTRWRCLVNISDMNVQATGVAGLDRAIAIDNPMVGIGSFNRVPSGPRLFYLKFEI